MRAFYKILTVILLLSISNKITAQNPFWTFPKEYWKVDVNININDLPDNTFSSYTHAGIMDPYGEILFYKIDTEVYDKVGNAVGSFDHATAGTAEALIVPQPGNCERFYIFQSEKSHSTHEIPYFSIYQFSEDTPGDYLIYNSTNTFQLEGGLIESWHKGLEQHRWQGVHYAATKERTDFQSNKPVRWIFISNNNDLYRLDLTCDTLESTNWKYNYNDIGEYSLSLGWRNELEIYEDTVSNIVRVAVPYQKAGIHIAVFDLDGNNGEVIPGSHKVIDFVSDGSKTTFVHGIEFSPDGKKLYISHDKNNQYPSPLSCYDLNNDVFTNLSFSDVDKYEYTQLQIAKIEGSYSLMLASNKHLGRLAHPNNPNTSNWYPNYLSLVNYPKSISGSFHSNDKFIIPDQIDYDDYEEMFFQTCDCCKKYAYAGKTASTMYEASANETWSYGFGNNPWNAEVGESIYIRDSLVIPAGKNITVNGMTFKFGPNARAIVKRGNGSTLGGHLTLTNNTVFTADFRCADKNYGTSGCADPNNNCDDRELWQGIRVEGHKTDLSQSTAYQARLTMSNGAKVEYAHTGVLVGHETKPNYGGGIVNISQSVFKDNVVGLEFQSYTLSTSGVEKFNKSVVKQNTFQTTSDWFVNLNPDAHVLVWNSSGLNLKGNLFENTNTLLTGSDRGLGVKSFDSRIIVEYNCTSAINPCPSEQHLVRSEFKNLYFGIYGANTQGVIRTIQSNYNVFHNNEVGIYLTNHLSPRILDNDFYLHQNSASTKGVVLLASTGYMVENNTFKGLNPVASKHGVGIVVNNSGSQSNEIYRNDFSKLYIGGLVEGLNGDNSCCDVGLQWLCNTFSEIRHSDIALLENATMATSQGISCNSPAGNLFSHSSAGSSPGHYDLFSQNSSLEINYRHHNNTGSYPRLIPLRYTNQGYAPHYFTFTTCVNSYSKNKCKVKNSGKPNIEEEHGPILGGKSFNDYWTQASSLQLQFESLQASNDNSVAEFNANENQFWNNLISAYQWDTTGVISAMQLNNLLTSFEPKAIDRFAMAVLGSSATSWSSTYAQAIPNYTTLPSLSENGLPIDIPTYFESDFFENLGNVHELNSLYKSNNTFYNPHVVLPGASLGKDIGGAKSLNPDEEIAATKIGVVPNPFKESVNFDFSAYSLSSDNNVLEFYDVLGKMIYSKQVSKNTQDMIVSGDKLPEGVVLFRFYTEGKLVESGKLIKVK